MNEINNSLEVQEIVLHHINNCYNDLQETQAYIAKKIIKKKIYRLGILRRNLKSMLK